MFSPLFSTSASIDRLTRFAADSNCRTRIIANKLPSIKATTPVLSKRNGSLTISWNWSWTRTISWNWSWTRTWAFLTGSLACLLSYQPQISSIEVESQDISSLTGFQKDTTISQRMFGKRWKIFATRGVRAYSVYTILDDHIKSAIIDHQSDVADIHAGAENQALANLEQVFCLLGLPSLEEFRKSILRPKIKAGRKFVTQPRNFFAIYNASRKTLRVVKITAVLELKRLIQKMVFADGLTQTTRRH